MDKDINNTPRIVVVTAAAVAAGILIAGIPILTEVDIIDLLLLPHLHLRLQLPMAIPCRSILTTHNSQ
jgi:hypothetical protein